MNKKQSQTLQEIFDLINGYNKSCSIQSKVPNDFKQYLRTCFNFVEKEYVGYRICRESGRIYKILAPPDYTVFIGGIPCAEIEYEDEPDKKYHHSGIKDKKIAKKHTKWGKK